VKDLVVATMYNNTEYYEYPIELWKKGVSCFDNIQIFNCSKINDPSDIAKYQNQYVKELKKEYKYVLWVQADLYFLSDRKAWILNNLGKNCSFYVEHIKQFYYTHTSNFGLTLINDSYFIEDGAYLFEQTLKPSLLGIDIGYFGLKNAKNHIKQQLRIWKQSDFIPPEYETIDIKSNIPKIIIPDGYYKPIFDYFDLYDEYKKFLNEYENSLRSD